MHTSVQTDKVNGSGGIVVPVPWDLKGLLAPWADATCISYDFGTIVRQVLSTPDYQVHVALFNMHRTVTLHPTWDTPTIALQYIKQGRIFSRLNGAEEIMLEPSRYNLFHVAAGKHISQPQKGLSESLRIEISPAFLQELLSAHPQLQKMLELLHQQHRTGGLLAPARMNGKVKNIIHEIYHCKKNGPSLYLEIKAHIYSLLSAYDEELTLAHDLENIQGSKMEKIIMAVQQFITSYPHIHECSLENLSRQFNVSPSTLKMHFKKHCQVALGDFVQQQCLLKAQELLLLDVSPVRDIAQQLGYTDVSNFSRAFRNYTGYTPNQVKMDPEEFRNSRKPKV
ncbi:AraC family transcriptional regulator [uncultured Chitinophaga sp.]|jgi:AraC-type DNA-binding domain-containing proteins|uniref:helix-turn-helix transcriptional regulator n=1 Tax=uncultured Chitinophaga sp. TaxID=339340 RepID=UPI00262FDB74|nr:AraC family transcriptional regulator [uncultured Chitinophaga sp.]